MQAELLGQFPVVDVERRLRVGQQAMRFNAKRGSEQYQAGTKITGRPPGGRRWSPSSGSHRT